MIYYLIVVIWLDYFALLPLIAPAKNGINRFYFICGNETLLLR